MDRGRGEVSVKAVSASMSKLSHYLAVTGAWMQVFPVVGIGIMAVQMNRAVKDMRF